MTRMTRAKHGWLWSFFIALIALSSCVTLGAQAQSQEWQFSVSPYLWVAGIHGTVGAPSSSTPPVNVDMSFSDAFTDFGAFGVMFGGEIRKGRFGLVGDLIWLRLHTNIDTKGLLFGDGKASFSTLEASLVGLYRVATQPRYMVDVGAGVRLWSAHIDASLSPGLLKAASADYRKTFVDPIIAVRANFGLARDWALTVYGDIGGFGISSSLTWQALATIDYHAAKWVDVRAGYRHMGVDRHRLELDLSGPIVGASFRF